MNKITFQFADESQTSGLASVHDQDGTLMAIYSFIHQIGTIGVDFEVGTNRYLNDIHQLLTHNFNIPQEGVCWI